MTEHWRDIPGFNGVYQASTEGRIRRYWPKSGRYTYCTPYTKKRPKSANRKALRVKLHSPDGRWVERPVMKLVAETFLDVREGMVAIHRNRDVADNSVNNIVLIPMKEVGVRFGANSCRRPVVKVTEGGEVLDAYKSAREAGRQNYLSYQAVMDRCNGKRKREFKELPFSFRWDDKKDGKRYE